MLSAAERTCARRNEYTAWPRSAAATSLKETYWGSQLARVCGCSERCGLIEAIQSSKPAKKLSAAERCSLIEGCTASAQAAASATVLSAANAAA